MVELRVDLSYFVGFWKLPRSRDIINTLSSSPVNVILKHLLHVGQHELTASTEAEEIVVIPTVAFIESAFVDPLSELRKDRFLLRTGVAHEARVYTFLWF